VSEFLADWSKTQDPSFVAIRIVGRQWEPRSHQLRDILTRVAMPYRFYPHDSQGGHQLLREAGRTAAGSRWWCSAPAGCWWTPPTLSSPSSSARAPCRCRNLVHGVDLRSRIQWRRSARILVMACRLLYLVFCQLNNWLAGRRPRTPRSSCYGTRSRSWADRSPGRDPPGRTGPCARRCRGGSPDSTDTIDS
jgi:hypothetical protein